MSPDCCRSEAWGAAVRTVVCAAALLRMGKELPETFWASLKTNKLLLLHPADRLLCLSVVKSKVSLKSDKNNGHFTGRPKYIYGAKGKVIPLQARCGPEGG